MAEGQRPKRKALHRGIADVINSDASDTSRLLSRVKARPLRQEPTIEQHTTAPETIEQGTIVQPAIAPEKPLLSHRATVEQRAIAQPAIVPTQYTSVPNGIFDNLLRTLNVYDQSILLRLYRLSRGYHKDTCTVGYNTLAKACNISSRQAQKSIDSLIDRELIKRVDIEQGGPNRQARGSVYKVNLPAATIARPATVERGAIARDTSNKESFKRKDNKKEVAAPDTKNCPDCDGMGVRYIDPLDYSKGTVKCKHEKLKPSPDVN